jgi:hypothetical protein
MYINDGDTVMNYTIDVEKWLSQRLGTEVMELPNLAIKCQLDSYDKAGSGVGFLLLLAMTSIDDESDDPKLTHYNLLSIPIVKLCNMWMTTEDENLSDILAGVIRMVAAEATNDTYTESEPEAV